MRNRGASASSVYIFMSGATSLFYAIMLPIELVYLVKGVGFSPLQLVLIGTLRQTIGFLLQAPTGILADMYSRRLTIVLGILLVGIGYFLEGFVPVVAIVFAAQVFIGLGVTLKDGADTAWIADEIGVERAGSVYLRASQVGSLVSLLGIALSAVLVNMRLNLPLVLSGGLFIVLSIVLALVMPEQHFTPASREGRSSWQQMDYTLRTGLRIVRLNAVLLAILSISVFTGVFSAGFDQLWQYYLLHTFTFPALGKLTSVTWFSLIEVCIALTNFCGTEIARRSVDTNSHRAVAVALCMVDGLSVVSVVGFALAGQFFLALAAFLLFTTVRGPRIPLEQVWMNQNIASSTRATIFSLRGQVNAIAQIVGGPLLGLIATLFTTRTALIVAGLILAPTLLLYVRTMRHTKPLTAHDAI